MSYRKCFYYDFRFDQFTPYFSIQFDLCITLLSRYFYRGIGALYGHLFSLVFNAPTIFHGTCTALAWVAVSGRYSSEKRTWKMPECRDNAFSRIRHWIRVSQTDTEPRRRISLVSPCETLTENSRATILPAKGYNKYGAIVTITLSYQMQATRTGSRRRYYCDVGVSQCWYLLSHVPREIKTRLSSSVSLQ